MSDNIAGPRFESAIVPLSKGGTDLVITCAVMSSLATIWTGLRFYSRRMKRMRILPEDYLVLAALICMYIAAASMICMVIFGGVGHHLNQLQPYHLHRLMKISFIDQIFYAISLGLVKCSICILLARVFVASRPLKIATYVAVALSLSWTTFTVITGLVICRPLRMFWDPTTPGGTCGNMPAAFASSGVVDVATDLYIFILPISTVWRLRIPTMNKIALLCCFALGIFTMTLGALRTVAILQMPFSDITYGFAQPTIYAIVEVGIAIIVSSGPVLRPLFDRIFRTMASIAGSTLGKVSGSGARSQSVSYRDSCQLERLQAPIGDSEVRLREIDAMEIGTLKSMASVVESEPRDIESARSNR